MDSTGVVKRYFEAMQAGPKAKQELVSLFAEDAVYVEPFSGSVRTHVGRSEIESYLDKSFESAPPELELHVDRIDVDGNQVRSLWTCTSPAFPAPVKGLDVCDVRAGKIQRLEVSFL